MVYQLPPALRQSLFPDLFLSSSKLNPSYPFVFTLESDIPDASIQTVTYGRFLEDVGKVADGLRKSAGVSSRQFGIEELRCVGMYGRSTYTYLVNWVAIQFFGWTVSILFYMGGLNGLTYSLVQCSLS